MKVSEKSVAIIVLIVLKRVYYLLLAIGPLFHPVKKPTGAERRFGERACFYLSLLWIGVTASLSLYLA
jgi:hypothetical protein